MHIELSFSNFSNDEGSESGNNSSCTSGYFLFNTFCICVTICCGGIFREKRKSSTLISVLSCMPGNFALSVVLNLVLSGSGRNWRTTAVNVKPKILACSINSFCTGLRIHGQLFLNASGEERSIKGRSLRLFLFLGIS